MMFVPANPGLSNPIFVTGYMHSGTSLLRHILMGNPSIFTGQGETRFFYSLPHIRREFPDLQDDKFLRDYVVYLIGLALTSYSKMHPENRSAISLAAFGITDAHVEAIVEEARAIREYIPLFRVIHDSLTRIFGKKRWLEKTPNNQYFVDDILKAIPEAQFLELVRDPRDILASKKMRSSKDPLDRPGINPERPIRESPASDPVWDTLGWKSAVCAGNEAKHRHPHSIYRVRYEDLVTHPEEEASRICSFLGLEFNVEMLDVPWSNATSRSKDRGIGTGAVGKWQRALAPEAVVQCQWLAKRQMDELGYTRAPLPLTARAKALFLIGGSGWQFVQRLYNRSRRAGFGYVRQVLHDYWRRLAVLAKSRRFARSGRIGV
jgi:hypothetical protein